jgi:iron complex transport system substrate-binding protein
MLWIPALAGMTMFALLWVSPSTAQSLLAAPTLSTTRIAALAPSLTELVFAAGAGDKLVAVSAYSDFPAAAKNLPQVSSYAGVNIEALLSHKPDLVLVWTSGTREADIARMKMLGMRVEAIGINRLDDVPVALRRIGVLAQTTDTAERAAVAFETKLKSLTSTHQTNKKNPLPVFIEIGRAPLMSVNGKHFISEAISMCGGTNVFADIEHLVFEPSREALLAKNPVVVIYPLSKAARAGRKSQDKPDARFYAGTVAATRQQIFAIEADHLLRPGPRLIEAAEAICRAMNFAKAQ